MRSLINRLCIQELFYGSFFLLIGVGIAYQHGWEAGLKAFFYTMVFVQPAVVIMNRKAIKSVLSSKA